MTQFLFDSDLDDDPYLPSPDQLRYKILIKNKKLSHQCGPGTFGRTKSGSTAMQLRAASLVSNEGGIHDYFDQYDEDDDDEEDEESARELNREEVGGQVSSKTRNNGVSWTRLQLWSQVYKVTEVN